MRPFTPAQIKLLETFADQAVIAIENVRLFKELKESLEQQTATSEILGVIASSPTDIQPVLDAIAENAARVCGSDDATIRLLDGEGMTPGVRISDRYHRQDRGGVPLEWRSVGNEAVLPSARRSILRTYRRKRTEFPDSYASRPRYSNFSRDAVAARRDGHRGDQHPPHGSPAFYR